MIHEWMRQSTVDILKYLPHYLSKDSIFKTSNDADSEEHEKIRVQLQDILDQFFITTATWGLAEWEEFLDITDIKGKTYAARRATIIAQIQSSNVVTNEFLTKLINNYVANEAAYIIEYPDEYRIEILYNGGQILDYDTLRKQVRTYLPAHLGFALVAYVEGNMPMFGAGYVQTYIKAPVELSSGITFDVDDKGIYFGGVVANQYYENKISGGY